MTKQEKIKEAYGRFYGNAEKHIRNDGSISEVIWKSLEIDLEYQDFSTGYFRPISLMGITQNNGWIKIEKLSDLPKKRTVCWIMDESKGIICGEFLNNAEEEKIYWLANATHYMPISEPNAPIY